MVHATGTGAASEAALLGGVQPAGVVLGGCRARRAVSGLAGGEVGWRRGRSYRASEHAGESACATMLDQRFAKQVGRAFTLPDFCHAHPPMNADKPHMSGPSWRGSLPPQMMKMDWPLIAFVFIHECTRI